MDDRLCMLKFLFIVQTQKNIIKTMIYVTVCFTVCRAPMQTNNALWQLRLVKLNFTLIYALLVLDFCSLILNPYLYAAHYDVVKEAWRAVLARFKGGSHSSNSAS
jgi:hypothetical protein